MAAGMQRAGRLVEADVGVGADAEEQEVQSAEGGDVALRTSRIPAS